MVGVGVRVIFLEGKWHEHIEVLRYNIMYIVTGQRRLSYDIFYSK
jgi:hypothetical protein